MRSKHATAAKDEVHRRLTTPSRAKLEALQDLAPSKDPLHTSAPGYKFGTHEDMLRENALRTSVAGLASTEEDCEQAADVAASGEDSGVTQAEQQVIVRKTAVEPRVTRTARSQKRPQPQETYAEVSLGAINVGNLLDELQARKQDSGSEIVNGGDVGGSTETPTIPGLDKLEDACSSLEDSMSRMQRGGFPSAFRSLVPSVLQPREHVALQIQAAVYLQVGGPRFSWPVPRPAIDLFVVGPFESALWW
eukprot:SAG11_NODE_1765_length_4285_cov_3.009795_6_plen_249_part_00